MNAVPVIAIRDLNFHFGVGALRRQILHNITLDFLPGEIVILTGPSGSGKTTLLTLAGALRSVQEGSLRICGHELKDATRETLVRVRRNIGFIFQAHNLLKALTARQNVAMALGLHGKKYAGREAACAAGALGAVGLSERVDHYPAQLSGGQKQRVAIARALAAEPRIVLADEPTAALDKKSGREVVEILQRLAKQQGCTVLMVTHDNRILDIADRILTLEDGHIVSFTEGVATTASQVLGTLASATNRGDLSEQIAGMDESQFTKFLDSSASDLEGLLKTLSSAQDQLSDSLLARLIEAVAFKVADLFDAERVTIFLLDRPAGLLRSKIARHDGAAPLDIVIPMSAGIAGAVAMSGKTLNIADVQQHPQFERSVDAHTGYVTRQILCMPLRRQDGEVFGVIELLNRRSGAPFETGDEQRLREFLRAISTILETRTWLAESLSGSARSRPI